MFLPSGLSETQCAPVGEPYFLPVISVSGRQKRETLTARNTTAKSSRERAEVRLERACAEKEKWGERDWLMPSVLGISANNAVTVRSFVGASSLSTMLVSTGCELTTSTVTVQLLMRRIAGQSLIQDLAA
jgi:hypothetical protein